MTVGRPSSLSARATIVKNLKFLDLDTTKDWPLITIETFAANDSVKNQKNRIQSAEWALYKLFEIWDIKNTRDVAILHQSSRLSHVLIGMLEQRLKPFFPSCEPLQSRNLRAALFRCLNDLKKDGVLGRDVALRKGLLDDCKGERFVDMLAAFSTAVLRKVVKARQSDVSITKSLALAANVAANEQRSMLPIAIAHRASLTAYLRNKCVMRRRYHQLGETLDAKAAELAQREERIDQQAQARGEIDDKGNLAQRLKEKLEIHWSGDPRWIDIFIDGDRSRLDYSILGRSFEYIWDHANVDTVNEIAGPDSRNLLEDLESRVSGQKARLAKWKDIRNSLSELEAKGNPEIEEEHLSANLDTSFSDPQRVQSHFEKSIETLVNRGNQPRMARRNSVNVIVEDYEQLQSSVPVIEAGGIMRGTPRIHDSYSKFSSPEKADRIPARTNGKTTQRRQKEVDFIPSSPLKIITPSQTKKRVFEHRRDDSKGLSDGSRALTAFVQYPLITPHANKISTSMKEEASISCDPSTAQQRQIPEADVAYNLGRLASPVPIPETDTLTGSVLSSTMNAEPLPVKSAAKPSLAERTRMSMSFTGKGSFNHAKKTSLQPPLAPEKQYKPTQEPLQDQDARSSLQDRTRMSMALIPPSSWAPPKPKRTRQSKVYPTNQFETPRKLQSFMGAAGPSTPAEQIVGHETDYASVFKSRPKIAMSPVISPRKETPLGSDDEVDGLAGSAVEGWGDDSSPLGRVGERKAEEGMRV